MKEEDVIATFRLLVKRGPEGFTPGRIVREVGCARADDVVP